MSEKPDTTNNDSGILRPIYYQPGKLIFHVHGNLRQSPIMVDKLMGWAGEVVSKEWNNKKASSIKISPTTPDINDYVFDFDPINRLNLRKKSSLYKRQPKSIGNKGRYKSPPGKMPPPFSLVFAKVESIEWPLFLTDSKHRGSKEVRKVQAEALDELLDIAILLDNRRGEAPVKLEVVSPNWLYSGGSFEDPGSTGGPGGKPSPVNKTDTGKYHIAPRLDLFLDSSEFKKLRAGINKDDLGTGVVVAILDTSYTKENLVKKYHEKFDTHPILKKLLGDSDSNGQLQIHTDSTDSTDSDVESYLPDLKIDGHDYDMTDHGLFVAGIINTIAPAAELHLYQVLNKHGLGDLSFIARALDDVLKNFLGRRLVINLSLTMNMPLEEGHLKAEDDLGVGRAILERRPWWLVPKDSKLFNWLIKWLSKLPWFRNSWFQRQAHPFEWICDLIYALDSRVIAAAGNDAKNRNQRPRALYPAAFDRVLGVGALADDTGSVVAASYSNLADEPTKVGITAFGGEPGIGNGILGVFLKPFPDGSDNDNGWAWWSGTSFATPVISGSTAAVLSEKAPGTTTEDAIKVLIKAQGLTTDKGNSLAEYI